MTTTTTAKMTKAQRSYLLGLLAGLRGHATSKVQGNCLRLGWTEIVCTDEFFGDAVTEAGKRALGM